MLIQCLFMLILCLFNANLCQYYKADRQAYQYRYFNLSYSKFARDLQIAQTQTQTQTQIPNKLKAQIRTITFGFFWVHISDPLITSLSLSVCK